MEIILSSIAISAIASLASVYIITLFWNKQQSPAFVSGLKSIFALMGLSVVMYSYMQGNISVAGSAMILATAFVGAVIIFYTDILEKQTPEWVRMGHGTAALIGYAILMSFAL